MSTSETIRGRPWHVGVGGSGRANEAEAIDGLENSLDPPAKLGTQSYQITFNTPSWASSYKISRPPLEMLSQ